MHSLSGGTAAMCGDHCSVVCFIKLNSKVVEPFDRIRSFHYQSFYQFRFCCKMSASKAVQIMLHRRIVFFICRLDSAFCHHGVCIADAEFCNDHDIGTCIMCLDSAGRSCTATTDHKYIYIVIDFCKIDFFVEQAAF